MRAIRLVRLALAMSAIGGFALIAAALASRIPMVVGVAGSGLLFLLVIPALLFWRMTLMLAAMNENRTSLPPSQSDPPDEAEVGQNPG